MSFHQTKLRALDYIRSHTLAKGEPPTMREIAYGIGQASPGSVHRIITILEAEGKIRRTPGLHRSIELVPVTAVISVELPPDAYEWIKAVARQAKTSLAAAVIALVEDGMQGNLREMERARKEASPRMRKDLSVWDNSRLPWHEASKKRRIEKRSAASRKAWRSRKRASRETLSGASNGRAHPQSGSRA